MHFGLEPGSNQNSLLLPSHLSSTFSPVPSVYSPRMQTSIPSLNAIPSLEIQIPDIPQETALPQQPICFSSVPSVDQTQSSSFPLPPNPPSMNLIPPSTHQGSYLSASSPHSLNSPPMYSIPQPTSSHSSSMYSVPQPHSPPPYSIPQPHSPSIYSVLIPHSPPSERVTVPEQLTFSPPSYTLPSSSTSAYMGSPGFASVPESPSSSDSVVMIIIIHSRDDVMVLITRRRRF